LCCTFFPFPEATSCLYSTFLNIPPTFILTSLYLLRLSLPLHPALLSVRAPHHSHVISFLLSAFPFFLVILQQYTILYIFCLLFTRVVRPPQMCRFP
jgi:hypothetical protein